MVQNQSENLSRVLHKKTYLSQLPPSCRLYKLLCENYTNRDFTYQIGLNEDHIPFNPKGNCSPGGLYFFDETQLLNSAYYPENAKFIALIELPDDCKIYVENSKQKADKFKIIKIETWDYNPYNYINFDNEEICKVVVKHPYFSLRFVPNQSLLICKLAVQQNGLVLECVMSEYKTEEISKLAVQQNGLALEHVNEQTDEICKLAIQQNGWAFRYVKEQTPELCKLAVQQEGLLLGFVRYEYKTPELCKLAVQQNGYALELVINQTDELCKLAVQQNGYALQYVKEQTPELCKLAVQQHYYDALQFVKEQTPEICKVAVQKDWRALNHVALKTDNKDQTEEICKLAVQQSGWALEYVKEQTEEICKLAVQKHGCALQFVKHQTPEICKLAVNQDYCALQYVKCSMLFRQFRDCVMVIIGLIMSILLFGGVNVKSMVYE